MTSLIHAGWCLDNEDYMITNNGAIAAKINDRISVIFSRDALIDANQIIEFKVMMNFTENRLIRSITMNIVLLIILGQFLEVPGRVMSDEGIALLSEPEGKNDSLKRRGCLMITAQGKIFMDGDEKLMQLPPVHSGTRVIFTITRRDEDTLRINIECADKAVTYYWNIDTPLYFAGRFLQSKKWNLMVK